MNPSPRVVVAGTDTGIGKTVFCAGLAGLLGARYWKPVQAGLDGPTDTEIVRALATPPPGDALPEAYRLAMPASPHRAAAAEGIAIDPARLRPPDLSGPLVIEGAGGVMVPLTPSTLFLDLFAAWRLPVVLCARTALGTINHTLLSLAALRVRAVPVLGVAFIGDEAADTQATIARLGGVRILGRLPWLDPLTPTALAAHVEAGFRRADFHA